MNRSAATLNIVASFLACSLLMDRFPDKTSEVLPRVPKTADQHPRHREHQHCLERLLCGYPEPGGVNTLRDPVENGECGAEAKQDDSRRNQAWFKATLRIPDSEDQDKMPRGPGMLGRGMVTWVHPESSKLRSAKRLSSPMFCFQTPVSVAGW